jgi:hypothetical protein
MDLVRNCAPEAGAGVVMAVKSACQSNSRASDCECGVPELCVGGTVCAGHAA